MRMSVDRVLSAIGKSPLSEEVKDATTLAVLDPDFWKNFDSTLRNRAPEQLPAHIDDVMARITPVLQQYNVPEENGRDTHRRIYEALGGTNPVKYELQ